MKKFTFTLIFSFLLGLSLPAQSHPGQETEAEKPRVQVIWAAHGDSKGTLKKLGKIRANIISIAGTASGLYYFYRTGTTEYEYKFLDEYFNSDDTENKIHNQEISGLRFVDAARIDNNDVSLYLVETNKDKVRMLYRSALQSELQDRHHPVSLHSFSEAHSESEITGNLTQFNNAMTIRGFYENGYEYVILKHGADSNIIYNYSTNIEYINEDAKSSTNLELLIQQQELDGAEFVKAARYDGWYDYVTLIFRTPVGTIGSSKPNHDPNPVVTAPAVENDSLYLGRLDELERQLNNVVSTVKKLNQSAIDMQERADTLSEAIEESGETLDEIQDQVDVVDTSVEELNPLLEKIEAVVLPIDSTPQLDGVEPDKNTADDAAQDTEEMTEKNEESEEEQSNEEN